MDTASENLIAEPIVTPRIAILRLMIGLVQGLLLYFLYQSATAHTWPSTQAAIFSPLLLVGVLAPPVLVSSLGHLAPRQALAWPLLATATLVGLALHDVDREAFRVSLTQSGNFPSPQLFFTALAGLFIVHALVQAGGMEKRRFASYTTYFEKSWTLLVQFIFALLFVGVLWVILWMGAGLFMLIKLSFLSELLAKPWFSIPVTAFAYSSALHLTDVRPAIVRGIRSMLLMLMSWILPVAVIIVAGFLCTLPWTGLEPLWNTKHASGLLMSAAAVLIVLINAAFQDGEAGRSVARIVRLAATAASLLLLPLVSIAIHALTLRVGDYGWTVARIIGAACMLVAAVYALGYAWAALPFHRRGWLKPIAKVNVFNAWLIPALMLALLSPLADPARISVNDQMARLADGRVRVEDFDFAYLKFQGARYGSTALNELSQRTTGADADRVRALAGEAIRKAKQTPQVPVPITKDDDLAANLHVWPKGTEIPEKLLKKNWNVGIESWQAPGCLRLKGTSCDVYAMNLSGEKRREFLVIDEVLKGDPTILAEAEDGSWFLAGTLQGLAARCAPVLQKMREGGFTVEPAQSRDVMIGGERLLYVPQLRDRRCQAGK